MIEKILETQERLSRARAPDCVRAGMNQPKPQMMAPVRMPATMKGNGAMPKLLASQVPPQIKITPVTTPKTNVVGADAVRTAGVVTLANERAEDVRS